MLLKKSFILIFLIRITIPEIISSDDGYLHAMRSYLGWNNEGYKPPVYTSFNNHPVDPYFLYHAGFKPFTSIYDNKDYNKLFLAVKIYHSILVTIFLLFFCIIVYSLLKNKIKRKRDLRATSAFLTTLFFLSSFFFSVRLLMERPQVFEMMAFMLISYLVISKKTKTLFIVALISPFFFSATFLLFIPPGVYLIYKILIEKKWYGSFKPIVICCLGLAIGILLRPNVLNYLYSGYWMQSVSLFDAIFRSGKTGAPAELLAFTPSLEFAKQVFLMEVWLLPMLLVIDLSFICKIFSFKKESYNEKLGFAAFLTFTLFTLTMIVSRALEIFLPVAFIFMIMLVISFWDKIVPGLEEFIKTKRSLSAKRQGFLRIVIIIGFLIFSFSRIYNFQKSFNKNTLPYIIEYKGISGYLQTYAKENDLIHIENFGSYPMLYFLNPKLSFTVGIDNAATYAYNPKIFWYITHINIEKDKTCPKSECAESEKEDSFLVMRDKLSIKYIFIDTKMGVGKAPKNYGLNEYLKNDKRYKLVFQDPNFENMKIYELP